MVVGIRVPFRLVTQLNRRSFLVGAVGTGLLVAACGTNHDNPTGTATGDTTTTAAAPGTVAFLRAVFPDGFTGPSPIVHSTEARLAYVLHDGVDTLRRNAPDSVDFVVTLEGEQVAAGTSVRRDEGVFTPYYPFRFTPPRAGTYTISLSDHPDAAPHQLLAVEPGESSIPRVGDLLPAVDTATLDNGRGVNPICTRVPPCPFHEINLTDALANGRPTVLSIATPGFCQTEWCGPVIDLLIETAAERDDLNVVHGEVYVDAQRDTEAGVARELTPVVTAYGLPFEPVLFIVAADGTILRRLDAVYDRSELAEALTLA